MNPASPNQPETPQLNPNVGIYLALGGGAARGFAHLGILQALEEAKIPIAGICGTSAGALVGACYALNPNADAVATDFINYIRSNHFDNVRYSFMKQPSKSDSATSTLRKRLHMGFLYGLSFTKGAVISFDDFRQEIYALVPHRSFKDLKIPFYATTVDLSATREVVIADGFVRSAVLASVAIPGVFPAVQGGNAIYVDGGWMNRIPVNPLLAFGARRTLAVDVSDSEPPPDINPRRGLSILNLANKAARERLNEIQIANADLHWRPPVNGIHWADFVSIEKTIEIGRKYAEDNMDQIHELLEKPIRPPKWRQWLRKLAKVEEPNYPITFDVRSLWDVSQADVRDEE